MHPSWTAHGIPPVSEDVCGPPHAITHFTLERLQPACSAAVGAWRLCAASQSEGVSLLPGLPLRRPAKPWLINPRTASYMQSGDTDSSLEELLHSWREHEGALGAGLAFACAEGSAALSNGGRRAEFEDDGPIGSGDGRVSSRWLPLPPRLGVASDTYILAARAAPRHFAGAADSLDSLIGEGSIAALLNMPSGVGSTVEQGTAPAAAAVAAGQPDVQAAGSGRATAMPPVSPPPAAKRLRGPTPRRKHACQADGCTANLAPLAAHLQHHRICLVRRTGGGGLGSKRPAALQVGPRRRRPAADPAGSLPASLPIHRTGAQQGAQLPLQGCAVPLLPALLPKPRDGLL